MKKRILMFLLAMVLVFTASVSVAAQTPTVMILACKTSVDGVDVTYWLQDAVSDQQLTVLVYRQTDDGKQGELLQVEQRSVSGSATGVLNIAVPLATQKVIVHLGGSYTTASRNVACSSNYTSPALFLAKEQTVEQLTEKLSSVTDLAVMRNGQSLSAQQTVQVGDEITGKMGNTPCAFWAVLPGDVDLNGAVEAADALQILRHTVGKVTLKNANLAAADFTQSGQVGAHSALRILQRIVGKVDSL